MEKITKEEMDMYNHLENKFSETAETTFKYILNNYPYMLQGNTPEFYDFYLTNKNMVIIYVDEDDDCDYYDRIHYWECPLEHVLDGTTEKFVDKWVVEEKERKRLEEQERLERERQRKEKEDYKTYLRLKSKFENKHGEIHV